MATQRTRRGLLGSAGAAGVVAAATLAGCAPAPGAGGGGPAASGGTARGPVSLEWTSWATDDYGKFREQERIDIWKQLNPDSNLTVTMNNFGGDYVQKLTALLVAGTGPDVFRLAWANVFPFMEQGYAAELDASFKKHPKSWLARPDLKKWIADGARYKGKLFAVPMGGDMSGVFVNRNAFRTAQVKPPPDSYKDPAYEKDWTFDQVLEDARRLTNAPTQYGVSAASDQVSGLSLVESFGGETLSKDWDAFLWHEEPAVRAWQWMADLRLAHRAAPTVDEESGFKFERGNLAMAWTEVSQMTYRTVDVKDAWDWDQTTWPHAAGKPVKVMFEYSGWALNKSSKHPDESFLWLHHVSGPDGTRPGVELGWELPLFKDLDPLYNKRIAEWKKNVKPALEGLDVAIRRHYFHHPRWSKAWGDFIGPAVKDVVTGKQGAAQALRAIKGPVDELMKEGAALMR
jgi:multiple sugar transport system substrate-binding protein